MGTRTKSDYLDKLGSTRTSSFSNKHYEDLLSTSKFRTTSGISSLYPTRTLPANATDAVSTGTGLSSTALRKSLSGATDSPMSATGHRPPSKAQRTSMGGSSAEDLADRGRFTSPARSLNRSLSAARAPSLAADRPASTSKSRPAAGVGVYTARRSASPLQSYHSLAPTRVTRSSTASTVHLSSQPLPTPKPTASYTSTQSIRHQAPSPSSTAHSQRLQKLYAAYTSDPAGKPSSRSISVGRRSSSDIAASLNRSLDLGIGSLGARSQPLQPLKSATTASGSRAAEPYLVRSSSRSREYQETKPSRSQQQDQLSSARSAQQKQLSSAEEGSGMLSAAESSRGMYGDSASSSSVSGKSSLIGRRSSQVFTNERASTRAQLRADGVLPSTSESAAELSSAAPLLARQGSTSSSNYQTTYQTAFSTPAPSLRMRKLSFKHNAHGEMIPSPSHSDLIQAVPSGSGRLSVGNLQEMQPLDGSHMTGKALITAALAKMGLTSRHSAKGFVGLSNLGNTCFANSVMQCLVAIPELVAYFLTAAPSGEQSKPNGPVSGAFGSLVQQLWASSGSPIEPYSFMKACGQHDKQWKDGRQHDAQEFLRSILEAMQTELNRVKGKPPYKELKGEGSVSAQAEEAWDYAQSRSSSVIQDIFAGQLQSTLQCPACGALSHTFDEFMDLSLPLPQKPGLSVRSPTCTIQECLDSFTETETLEEEEGYNCRACKRKGVCATKKLTLYRCPPVLVLHIKRFSSNNGSLGMFSASRFSAMSKDTTKVQVVADKLDLSPYCSVAARKQAQPPLYTLAAVNEHSGSMAGGHYTAHCRSVLDEKWYDCNDSCVREEKYVKGPSSSAYVLFYRRQD